MNAERAMELQQRIAREALAMLAIHGSAADSADYARAVILIGAAWGLDPKSAAEQLELIARERETALDTESPGEADTSCPRATCP